MKKKRGIVIMAEFGDAIFWNVKRTIIGGSEGVDGCTISKELLKEFSNWSYRFETDNLDEYSTKDWNNFHKDGIELCKKLKLELIDVADIYYEKAFEDPLHKINERILIE